MCPKDDCFTTYYKSIEIAQFKDYDKEELFVGVFFSSEPETSYHHKSSLQLIEFLCYLASTVVLWFGVSIFSIIFYSKSINFKKIFAKINYLTVFHRF